ncbi:MAG: hypothetical protein ACKOCX_08050 [Planctomycetota bacterium]
MGTATARSAGRVRPAAGDRDSSGPWPWLVGLGVVAVIAFLIAWLGGWIRFTTDPRVAEILALQEQARDRYAQLGGGTVTLADATAAATAMMEIRQKTEALPEHLRPQVERNGSDMFRSAFRARIDRYFALPPEKRMAEIDRQIDEEETWRKAFEAGQAMMQAMGAGGQQGQQAQQGQGGAPTGQGSQPWASRSEEERNRWRKGMIDRTTPEERARYTEWRRARDARREQRGLPERWPR